MSMGGDDVKGVSRFSKLCPQGARQCVFLWILALLLCTAVGSKVATMMSDAGALEDICRNYDGGNETRDLKFSYWDRGGPPGDGYESNFLEVETEAAEATVRFTKVRYDEAQPPYRVEVFLTRVPLSEVALLRCLGELAPWSSSYPEEVSRGIGDDTKITLTIGLSPRSVNKTFHGALPRRLARLGEEVVRLMKYCEEHGEKTVSHRG